MEKLIAKQEQSDLAFELWNGEIDELEDFVDELLYQYSTIFSEYTRELLIQELKNRL